jgi:hypothetical protein
MSDDWQPISTAPRDKAVLVYGHTHEGGSQVFKALQVSGEWRASGSWWLVAATHWRPLPPPPREAADGR